MADSATVWKHIVFKVFILRQNQTNITICMWLTRICLQTLAGNSCQKYSIILKCVNLKLILKLCHVLHTLTLSEDLADKALKLWKFFIHQHLNIYSLSHVKSFKCPNIWLYNNIKSFQSKIYKRMFVPNLF